MLSAEEKGNKIEKVLSLVNNSDIASIKNVISGIIQIINDPKSTVQDLRDIVEIDPPLTAKMLKIANSAYYSPPVKLAEINKAIIWIGFEAMKEIALSQKAFTIFETEVMYSNYSSAALWENSVAIALFGKYLYRREFGNRGETAYIAGLLHNIGLIAEDQFLHKDFNEAIELFEKDGKNLNVIESEIFGYDHSDLGQRIIESWNLSDELKMAVGYHHKPHRAPKKFTRICSTVFVSDYYCRELNMGFSDIKQNSEELFSFCMKTLGIKPQSLELIAREVMNEINIMKAKGIM